MKETPILMSVPMVRALLDERKGQTRRVIKPQDCVEYDENTSAPIYVHSKKCGGYCDYACNSGNRFYPYGVSPYGLPGDHLWVRESWQLLMPCTVCFGSGEDDWDWESEEADAIYSEKPEIGTLCYKADDPGACKWWRPSIHMPRWASRITLEITEIRVQHVQEITEEDAIAEGIDRISDHPHWAWRDYTGNNQKLSPIFSYQSLWDSINADRGFSFDSNPWVWAISFRRV